jgi:hypothetical protein
MGTEGREDVDRHGGIELHCEGRTGKGAPSGKARQGSARDITSTTRSRLMSCMWSLIETMTLPAGQSQQARHSRSLPAPQLRLCSSRPQLLKYDWVQSVARTILLMVAFSQICIIMRRHSELCPRHSHSFCRDPCPFFCTKMSRQHIKHSDKHLK